MHVLFPLPPGEDTSACGVHRLKNNLINFITPPSEDTCRSRRYAFSMFYTTAHVFAFMNSIVYWGVLVPAGHGGFKIPSMPQHGHNGTEGGEMFVAYDPGMATWVFLLNLPFVFPRCATNVDARQGFI